MTEPEAIRMIPVEDISPSPANPPLRPWAGSPSPDRASVEREARGEGVAAPSITQAPSGISGRDSRFIASASDAVAPS